jgi:hypothetical protein
VNLVVNPPHEHVGYDVLDLLVIHEPSKNLLIRIHAINKQSFQCLLEHELEIVHRVRHCRLQCRIRDRLFADLAEEQFISGSEPRPKALVYDINQAGEFNFLIVPSAGSYAVGSQSDFNSSPSEIGGTSSLSRLRSEREQKNDFGQISFEARWGGHRISTA